MIVTLTDTKGARHFHRVLVSALPAWEALGWALVAYDDSSPSLRAQGMSACLIEWSGASEPKEP